MSDKNDQKNKAIEDFTGFPAGIRDFVLENAGKLRCCRDAYGELQIVVDQLSVLSELDTGGRVNIIREGGGIFLEDVATGSYKPVYEAKEFFKEKAETIKFLKSMGLDEGLDDEEVELD